VKAKATAPAAPNMAARHHRGPRSAASTAITMTTPQAEPATAHSSPVGDRLPPVGWAKIRKPARPPAAATHPSHSRSPIRKRNHVANSRTKKSSSVVRMGCTWLRSPRWRATACMRNEAIMKANPSSHTPRLSAWVNRLSFRVDSAGASSTPMRWSRLVRALESAAARDRR